MRAVCVEYQGRGEGGGVCVCVEYERRKEEGEV